MRVIKFNAVWCPGCLVTRKIFKEITEEIPGLDIIEYDYDMDEDMVEKYNVGDKLPVVIIENDDNIEIKRIIGEKSKEEYLKIIKEV